MGCSNRLVDLPREAAAKPQHLFQSQRIGLGALSSQRERPMVKRSLHEADPSLRPRSGATAVSRRLRVGGQRGDAGLPVLSPGGTSMRITYDREVDALYFRFRDTTVTTKHLGEGIAADYDSDGRLAGIEILDAISRLGDPEVLRQVILEGVGPRRD